MKQNTKKNFETYQASFHLVVVYYVNVSKTWNMIHAIRLLLVEPFWGLESDLFKSVSEEPSWLTRPANAISACRKIVFSPMRISFAIIYRLSLEFAWPPMAICTGSAESCSSVVAYCAERSLTRKWRNWAPFKVIFSGLGSFPFDFKRSNSACGRSRVSVRMMSSGEMFSETEKLSLVVMS